MRSLLVCLSVFGCVRTGDDTDPPETGTPTDDTGPTGEAVILINELLAVNASINVDEAGDYDDWIELYNAGVDPVDLQGWQLTDGYGSEFPWPIPAGNVLDPGGYLLVWADEDPGDGLLHADFKLSGTEGETLTLLDPKGVVQDEVAFGPQVEDISWARSPNASDTWQPGVPPTPLAANP